MTDRSRGGAAEVTQKSTIEIMHHRRVLEDDVKGVEEELDEQNDKDYGIKVNGRYFMHIFDRTRGKSL